MKIIIAVIVLLLSSTFLVTESFAQSVVLPNSFETIVFTSSSRYYAQDSSNTVFSGSNTPDIVIKTALDRGGDIYISGGQYVLSKNFAGFDIKSGTNLKLAKDVVIVVPSGYSGYVFRFNSGTAHSVIDGGTIAEASPVKRSWTGIMMQGGTTGIYFNFIQNMIITDPNVVIDFNAASGQWINGNTFVNIQGYTFLRGIEFDFKGNLLGNDGFDGNTFRDLQFQSGSMTTYGIKDIKHDRNAFYNVQVWDLPPKAVSATIDSTAVNTIIIGGSMTHQGFVDKGVNTIILDAWHNSVSSNSAIISTIINGTYQQPKVNTPTLSSPQRLNVGIVGPPASGFVNGNHAQIVITQENPTDTNIYGTVSNPKGGSVVLSITRPDGIIEQNQAYVTSTGIFYYPMVFDKTSLIGQYKIDGTYQNSNIGSLFLNVTSDQIMPTTTYSKPNIGTPITPESNTTFSISVKSSAKLWSQSQINDDVFEISIQNLVKSGIIDNTNGGKTSSQQSLHIPTWFKNNAGWWADGQISGADFISELQYLLNDGIMQIPSQ